MNFNNKEQKMNLKDLARMIHSDLESQGKGIDMKTVLTVVKQVVDTISNGYSEDKYSKIVIPGFGSFINY